MPKKIRINKQLTAGRPRTALDKSEPSEKYGSLPKKIVGSHMGYMQTGDAPTAPIVKGPALGKAPKQPKRPSKAPPF